MAVPFFIIDYENHENEDNQSQDEDDEIMEISPTLEPTPPVTELEDEGESDDAEREQGRYFIRVRNAADGIFEEDDDDGDDLRNKPKASGQSRKREQDMKSRENDKDYNELDDKEFLKAFWNRQQDKKDIQILQLTTENKQLREYVEELKQIICKTVRCGCPSNKNADLTVLDKVITVSPEHGHPAPNESPSPGKSTRPLLNTTSSQVSSSVVNITEVAVSRPSLTIIPVCELDKPTSAIPFETNVSDDANAGESSLQQSKTPSPSPITSPQTPTKPAEPPKTASQMLFERRKQQQQPPQVIRAPCNLLNHSRRLRAKENLPSSTATSANFIPITSSVCGNAAQITNLQLRNTFNVPKPSEELTDMYANSPAVFRPRRGRPPKNSKPGLQLRPVKRTFPPEPSYLSILESVSSPRTVQKPVPSKDEEIRAMWKSLEKDDDEIMIIETLQGSSLQSSLRNEPNRSTQEIAKMQTTDNKRRHVIPERNYNNPNFDAKKIISLNVEEPD